MPTCRSRRCRAAPIRIVNKPLTETTLSYALNDYPYEIKPGEVQSLAEDRTWVIEFDRSGDFGVAQYTLEPGEYSFAMTDHGWELYHQSLSDAAGESPPSAE